MHTAIVAPEKLEAQPGTAELKSVFVLHHSVEKEAE
jgi:hypothetical protein